MRQLGFLSIVFFLGPFFAFSQSDSSQDIYQGRLLLGQAQRLLYTQPNQAQLHLEQALNLARRSQNFGLEAEVCKQLVILYSNAGNYTQAREHITGGILAAEKSNSTDLKGDMLYLSGTIYYALGKFSYAAEKFLEALRIFEERNNAIGTLNTYLSLAELYSRQNNFSRAIDYNLKALRLFEQKNDRFRKLNIYEQLGGIYARQKQFDKATEYYLRALKTYQELGNPTGEAASLINLAQVELNQLEPENALLHFKEAFKKIEKFPAVPLEIQCLLGMARCHVLLKEYPKASAEYRKVIALAKKSGMRIQLDEAYEGLAEIYKSLNNPTASKAYRSLSSEIKDSLFNDSILRQTANLQLQFETEKKQHQIDRLKQQEEVNNLELSQTRQVKNFFIVLSVLLVLLILIFVFFISQNRRINRELKHRYVELIQKNQEIEKQKEQVTQLNQVKDRFFSIISHDLRNNLTTMKLYFDLVSNPAHKAESTTELGREVAGSVQNTIDLLENLLVWASGQIKGLEVQKQRVSLYALAEENCQMLLSVAHQKGIRLSNETDEEAFVLADLNMLNLILRNLLSNAMKFTPTGGSVTVLSQEEGEFHQIIVIDDGVGISKSKIESLFTAHQQVSTKGTGNEKGTGLGLLLCKEFVEKNGGKIWVESEEGKGSSFIFTFPKA